MFLCAAPAAAQTLIITPQRTLGPDLGPKTVTPALVACADVPTTAPPMATLRIVAPHAVDKHLDSTRNDLIVVNAGTPQGLLIGQRYFTRRVQPPLNRLPISPADPGSVRTSGWLTIVAADERSALARIDYACTSVEAGDYLEPYVEPTLPETIAEGGPTNFADLGHVLFGLDRREAFGSGDFLTINRGAGFGLTKGTRVAFYRDRRNGTPLVEIGSGIVIETTAETSKVIVERSSQEVRRDDYVGVRGRP
jgi:hypothetical protein